jgi:hypothetical protein
MIGKKIDYFIEFLLSFIAQNENAGDIVPEF